MGWQRPLQLASPCGAHSQCPRRRSVQGGGWDIANWRGLQGSGLPEGWGCELSQGAVGESAEGPAFPCPCSAPLSLRCAPTPCCSCTDRVTTGFPEEHPAFRIPAASGPGAAAHLDHQTLPLGRHTLTPCSSPPGSPSEPPPRPVPKPSPGGLSKGRICLAERETIAGGACAVTGGYFPVSPPAPRLLSHTPPLEGRALPSRASWHHHHGPHSPSFTGMVGFFCRSPRRMKKRTKGMKISKASTH